MVKGNASNVKSEYVDREVARLSALAALEGKDGSAWNVHSTEGGKRW